MQVGDTESSEHKLAASNDCGLIRVGVVDFHLAVEPPARTLKRELSQSTLNGHRRGGLRAEPCPQRDRAASLKLGTQSVADD
jgi:hypothetical protein